MSKTSEQVQALANANAPAESNPVATIADIPAGGSGDVTGPAGGVVVDELAVYSDTTGKVIKGSSGAKTSDFATAAQGATADSALQTVATDATITGDGTAGDPLSAVPTATDLTDAVFPTFAQFDSAVSSSQAVDFDSGNKQFIANANGLSLTFSASNPGSFILDLRTNSDSLTAIETPVLWDSGTVPTWAGRSVLALYFDGTTWFGSAMVGVA